MIELKEGEKIRTLGLYQPYATLMLYGKIETRWIRKGNKVPFPKGKYLLYSCKKEYTRAAILGISGFENRTKIESLLKEDSTSVLRGAALAIGDLEKHIYVTEGMEDRTFVKYQSPHTRVMVGLIFNNVRRIKPFAFKGKQGVGFLTPEDIEKIEFIDDVVLDPQ